MLTSKAQLDPLGSTRQRLPEESLVLKLLVVDDDASLRKACCEIGASMGLRPLSAANASEARSALKSEPPVDFLLLDVKLPDGSGLELLHEVKALYPHTTVVVMTAYATVPSAVEAMRTGASNYLTKPFALGQLTDVLDESIRGLRYDIDGRRLREQLRTKFGMGSLVGTSAAMERVYSILTRVASATHPVLILGETGTGKEAVARSIHSAGRYSSMPCISVDCGSVSPLSIEAQLFGYSKGALPGMHTSKEGLLSAADGGTVLLNDIDKLPLDVQSKLFRTLRDKVVYPVGASQAVPLSTRILAATTRDLNALATQGLFRKDLYLRLNIVNISIPSLCDRKDDIPLLIEHYLNLVQRDSERKYAFSQDAFQLMMKYDWPDNLSELQHAIGHACAITSSSRLDLADLPVQLRDFEAQQQSVAASAMGEIGGTEGSSAGAAVLSISTMEKHAILSTIQQCEGNKILAAKLLGIGKTTLYRKLKEYDLVEASLASTN